MRRLTALLCSLLATALTASSSQAAGLVSPDIGSIGMGRGGAYTARAADAVGGLYYNPAGLWQLKGFSLQGGLQMMNTRRSFQRPDGEGVFHVDGDGNRVPGSEAEAFPEASMRNDWRPIPEIAIAYGFERPELTIAFGLYGPLAPIQSYDLWGPGRYRLIDQTLIQGNFALGVGWKPLPFLSVGATVQLLVLQLSQTLMASADFTSSGSAVNPEDPQWDVLALFEAGQLKPYFSLGTMIMPTPWLRVGVSFSPPYSFSGQGSATLEGELGAEFLGNLSETLGGGPPILLQGRDEEILLTLGLPGRLKVGVNVEPVAGVLDLEVGVDVEFWRGGGDVVATDVDVDLVYDDPDDDVPPVPVTEHLYDRGICPDFGAVFGIDCGDPATRGAGSAFNQYVGTDGEVVIPASYDNSWSLRFGGEARPRPDVGIRFGYQYEPPAIPDSSMSLVAMDSHKHLVAGGLSLRLGTKERGGPSLVDVHLTYGHIFYLDREISADDSRGRTLALPGVPTNPIDAGLYRADVHLLSFNVGVHFSELSRRQRARRTGG